MKIKNIYHYIQGHIRYYLYHNDLDIYYYIQGHVRYYLYYNDLLVWLLPTHIIDQIEFRIKVMNQECFSLGSCIKCGCKTTHLQMCDKACDGDCYPKMYSKESWKSAGPIFKRMYDNDPEYYYNFIKNFNK